MKMKICAGQWIYVFKDKTTLKMLSFPQIIITHQKETEIDIPVPEELKSNKNAILDMHRLR